ncbi:MAG: hypothetical protein A2Y84_01540 [Candidatus Colwellbacteria bacterium RBG_13_48_8]|uniref:Uncharacterized protein n=1 Tax=Candidatus Colwellbacteria bacterium RBG_13_48_8 TaxID=1797685 RepID=A0A1G1YY78_9BACT|nr:MAG: hypothetical protein A2Y84_01540 [Candidatus Colwellbacteria bacterium RBG_13_48_8]
MAMPVVQNHAISPEDLQRERRCLNAQVARVGFNPTLLGKALDLAAGWICREIDPLAEGARRAARRYVAQLLSYRAVRKGISSVERKRREALERTRREMIKKGIDDGHITKLSQDIAGQTPGLGG